MDQENLNLLVERSSVTHEVLQAICDLSCKIDEAQANAEKEAIVQKRIDRTRFWITSIIALIGSLAAIGGLIATIVLR